MSEPTGNMTAAVLPLDLAGRVREYADQRHGGDMAAASEELLTLGLRVVGFAGYLSGLLVQGGDRRTG